MVKSMNNNIGDKAETSSAEPDSSIDVRKTFGVDIDWKVPAFSKRGMHVPEIDESYVFDPDTTLAILAGFAHNRRVMVQGYHGTGKSTHIEQVAARLNWPSIRVNLDAHISRIDLVDGCDRPSRRPQTEFKESILPGASNAVALTTMNMMLVDQM